MKNWLLNLINSPKNPPSKESATPTPVSFDEVLQGKNELQSLRIDQSADKRTIEHLTEEIERLRTQQTEIVQLNLAKEMEGLYRDLAAPASQIMTQAYLLESQGKPVQAQDILTVSRRMLRAMERHGLVFEGSVGEKVVFDPGRHISIQSGKVIETGLPVIVRFSGVSYGGKMIHKAIVEQETACRED
jgi:hypothetical protein